MSAFQPPQPVSIDWHVRDKDKYGTLKVYLFQNNPELKPIVKWRNALVEKLNQYNLSQFANRGFFTLKADGSTTSRYQNQTYTLGPVTNQANYVHFQYLHTKYPGDFCGDGMDSKYLDTTINSKNRICMYVTDDSTGEERLHSVVTFYLESITMIYIDVFCTSTVPGYVQFRGGYRLMSLLYGICRLLRMGIRLHSLDAPIDFYKSWGFVETCNNTTNNMPEMTSNCNKRHKLSFKEAVKHVIDSKEQKNAFAETINEHFHSINLIEIENSGETGFKPDVNVEIKTVIYGNHKRKYDDVHKNDYAGLWNVNHSVFTNGVITSYNLYRDDDDGNPQILLNVPADNVETMEEWHNRIAHEKQRDAREEVNKSFINRPTGNHLLNRHMKWLTEKQKKLKQKWTEEDENEINSNGLFKFSLGGSSRKQPRKTKTKKRRRNSKKIYKAKNLI